MSRSDEILDIAQNMIQTRGYNGFSFQDISNEMGIKKASVQFYFPKKADLGRAVVQRYAKSFKEHLKHLDNDELAPIEKFHIYQTPFRLVANNNQLACLCGVLCGELNTLPEEVQTEVADFFDLNEKGLGKILEACRKSGSLTFKGSSLDLAKSIFSSFQGALLLGRSRGDDQYFDKVARTWLRQLMV